MALALKRASSSTAAIPIPEDIAGVDAAWLTLALGSSDPGLVVEHAEVVQSLGGACTKLRVALQTNRDGFPPTVIVKGCLEPHGKGMMRLQTAEANFYNKVIPRLDVPTVHCFFAQGNLELGSALIMEDLDLRGVRCLRTTDPMDYRLALAFIDVLARLHARWWDDPILADDGELGWIPGPKQPALENHLAILRDPEQTAKRMALPRAAAVPHLFHDGERLLRAYEKMWSNHLNLPHAFIHGDPHLANLYVDRDGGPGLLDWTSRRGPWALDVAYFIVGNLDIIDRRRWEAPLLQHYLSRLAELGVAAPSFDEAWLAYRCWMTWGMAVWLVNRTDYHSESAITAAAARFGAAMADSDSYGALGV
jgi:hypothetical protein